MSTCSARLSVAGRVVLLACLAVPAAAQDYVLDVSVAANAKAVTYQVPSSGGTIPLTLFQPGTSVATTVTVTVTAFLSEAGARIEPRLMTTDQGGTQVTLPATAVGFVACTLVIPPLGGPGPYTGSLVIRTGNAAPVRQVVTVTASTPARPAALQIAPESTTQPQPFTIANPLWRETVPAPPQLDLELGPTFDIQLGDAAGRWMVDNIDVGPVTVTKAPDGFSSSQHIAFYDAAGKQVTFPRSVPVSGETLTMQLRNVIAGEYVATLPFRATNAALEPRKFTFAINVRHHVGWAILCLSIALLASFSASKLVEIRNERLRLSKRLEELRPRWLDEEEETFAIVWISSILTQARELSHTWFLPSVDTVHACLDKVQALLQRIDRLRRVRVEIRDAVLPQLACTRALKIADRIADRLDPDMDQDALTEQTNAITELRGWTRAGESSGRYAADLGQSIIQLLIDVKVQEIPPVGQSFVQQLITDLNAPLPTAFVDLDKREETYAKLQILWGRRDAPEFPDLLQTASGPVAGVFKRADREAWKRLKRSQLRLTHSGGSRVDAHEPLLFTFSTGNADLDETYLVRHGLRYEWTFSATGSTLTASGMKPRSFPLEAITYVPRVPQYAPFPGTFEASVKVFFEKESQQVNGKPLTVSRSRKFAAVNGFSAGEIVQFLLAIAAAIITGLQTFYYKAGGFGSLSDYLALFAWGATIDQLKNFLQKLPSAAQSIQGAAAATTTQGATQQAAATQGTATQQAATQQAATQQAGTQQSGTQQSGTQQTATITPAANKPAPEIADPEKRQALDLENEVN